MMNEVPSAAPAATATSTWLRPPTFGPPSSSRASSAPATSAHADPDQHERRRPLALDQAPGDGHDRAHHRGHRGDVLIRPCARPWYSSPRPSTLADPAIAPKARSRPVTSALIEGRHQHGAGERRELGDEQHPGGRGPLRGARAEEVPRSERDRDEQADQHRHGGEPRNRRFPAVSVPEPYSVTAFNTDTASANRIHDDATAQRFGFRGGLVPGVDVYAYLTHPPAAAWGRAWLEGGAMVGPVPPPGVRR